MHEDIRFGGAARAPARTRSRHHALRLDGSDFHTAVERVMVEVADDELVVIGLNNVGVPQRRTIAARGEGSTAAGVGSFAHLIARVVRWAAQARRFAQVLIGDPMIMLVDESFSPP